MCRRLAYLFLLVTIVALVPGGVARALDVLTDPALIGWWTFDEGSGTIAADSSANKRDGTFFQGSPAWVSGMHGSAVELRIPTLIQVPALGLTLSQATMAGWIKPYGAQPDWASIIMHRPTAHGFNVLADFQLAYHWNDDAATYNYRGNVRVANNDWSFAAVTIQPTKATFYLNGVSSAVNAITHNPAPWTANFYFGGDGSGSFDGRRMTGALDDVSFWSRALTDDEIKEIMLGAAVPGPATSPAPKSGAVDVPRDVVVSWKPGPFAKTHDVYFGTGFDDVNSASGGTPLGVLVSKGQDAAAYDRPACWRSTRLITGGSTRSTPRPRTPPFSRAAPGASRPRPMATRSSPSRLRHPPPRHPSWGRRRPSTAPGSTPWISIQRLPRRCG
jgi:hypothetical protein